ncbi:MAG: alkaline phosphatase family protein [Candidatus Thermoplasmatota archaeon]|nr:alkaline phosphatase family protein [Candidatus Thermoplasmatota archaeon]
MSNMRIFLAVALSAVILIGGVQFSVASQPTQTPIKHLVIIMMENHSFDNLFGTYGRLQNGSMAPNLTVPYNLLVHNSAQNLTAVSNGTFKTGDPYEGYFNYHADWNNGSMNGFLNNSGPNSLRYFTSSQMGLEWYFAHQYSIADMYFSSTLSETLPNRLYSLAGFSPVKADQLTPPPYVPYDQTIFNEMDSYGVSWAYYLKTPVLGNYPLDFISGMSSHLSNIGTWGNFYNSVQNGTLPQVSWISPISGAAYGYSQHPPYNMLAGEIWMFYFIHLIMESRYWSNTAIMVTYDEGGGYYDQVAPPKVDGHQLGFRVPFILISPYAKENYVSNTIMSHTSILGFIDYNWNMPALNPLVSDSNLMLDMFNFNRLYKTGTAIRPPLNFTNGLLNMLPATPVDSLSLANAFTNVSDLYPGKLQYNISTLPYPEQGQGNTSISNLSGNVFVKNNYGFTPWYFNSFITVPSALIAISLAFYGSFRIVRKRIRKKKGL